MEWFGPDSNRHCLHSSLEHNGWKADAGPPPSRIHLHLHPQFIVGLWGDEKKGKEETFYGSGQS
jgi:hypothetical protein